MKTNNAQLIINQMVPQIRNILSRGLDKETTNQLIDKTIDGVVQVNNGHNIVVFNTLLSKKTTMKAKAQTLREVSEANGHQSNITNPLADKSKTVLNNVRDMLNKHKQATGNRFQPAAGSIAARAAKMAVVDHKPDHTFVQPKTTPQAVGKAHKVQMPAPVTSTAKAAASKFGLKPGSLAYKAMMTAKAD